MKRFISTITAFVAAVLLLSACKIVAVEPPRVDYERAASLNPNASVWDGSLAPGESVIFRLTVPTSVKSSPGIDVLYLELNNGLNLALRNPTNYNDIIASSSSAQFYARRSAGLSTMGEDLGTQAIGTVLTCRGSCIIIPAASANAFYASVTNTTSAAVSASLYFYGETEQDEYEDNDTISTAVSLDLGLTGGDTGAIERLGDLDYWRVAVDGAVQFITASGNPVDLRLRVVNSNGQTLAGPIVDGSLNVAAGSYLLVYSASDRAGAPASSGYTLLGGIVPPGPPVADFSLTANNSPTTAAWNGQFTAGQSIVFKLSVPSSVTSVSDVVYAELDKNLNLEMRNASGYNVVASSSSASFYAPGLDGLVVTAADAETQAIAATVSCRGSCVIVPSGSSSTYYAKVTNTGSASINANFYFFGEAEMDTSEANDSIATANTFDASSAAGDQGAIELLYDRDYWRATTSGSIEFITATGNPVDLRLEVVDSAGQRLLGPIGNGGTVSVVGGDYLLVYSVQNRAGAPAASQYTLLGGL